MEKNKSEIREELLEDLSKQEIPAYEVDYVRSVVDYIDRQMEVKQEETATLDMQVKKMVEIIGRIQQGKTGVPVIDEIKSKRREDAISQVGASADMLDFSTWPYVNDCIRIISDNGGLFAYINERNYKTKEYEQEVQPNDETGEKKKPSEVREELLQDLREQDISECEVGYITSVVRYIDEHMTASTEEAVTIETQRERMIELVSKIQQEETGIPEIDEIKLKRKEEARRHIGDNADTLDYSTAPYVDNYIRTISRNGGLFGYVTEKNLEQRTPHVDEEQTITMKSAVSNAISQGVTKRDIDDGYEEKNKTEGVTKDD